MDLHDFRKLTEKLARSNPSNPSPDDWHKWRNHVLIELERQNDVQGKIFLKLDKLTLSFVAFQAAMKVKAGLWGAVGAAIPTIAAVIFILLKLSGRL